MNQMTTWNTLGKIPEFKNGFFLQIVQAECNTTNNQYFQVRMIINRTSLQKNKNDENESSSPWEKTLSDKLIWLLRKHQLLTKED